MTAPQALFALLAYYGAVLLFLRWMTTRHVAEPISMRQLAERTMRRYPNIMRRLAE